MNDEPLILYYYGDGLSKAERRRIEAALAADPALRRRYEALQRDLDLIEDVPVTVPEHVLSRWHDNIDRAARREQRTSRESPRSFHFASFALGGALAAVLAVGIGLGAFVANRNGSPVTVSGPPATAAVVRPETGSSPFSRGLEAHFLQSRQEISALPVEDNDERRVLILQIVQQNRLFAREAVDNRSPELARVLRAFEPVLLQLANEDLNPEEIRHLQSKLSFELDVMLTKMGRPPSNRSESI